MPVEVPTARDEKRGRCVSEGHDSDYGQPLTASVSLYIGIIKVYSPTLEHHLLYLEAFFKRLEAANLKFSVEKTKMARKKHIYTCPHCESGWDSLEPQSFTGVVSNSTTLQRLRVPSIFRSHKLLPALYYQLLLPGTRTTSAHKEE